MVGLVVIYPSRGCIGDALARSSNALFRVSYVGEEKPSINIARREKLKKPLLRSDRNQFMRCIERGLLGATEHVEPACEL